MSAATTTGEEESGERTATPPVSDGALPASCPGEEPVKPPTAPGTSSSAISGLAKVSKVRCCGHGSGGGRLKRADW